MCSLSASAFKYGDDSQQFCHLYRADTSESLPVVIVIHGGYWKDNHSLDSYATKAIVEYLCNLDVAVWNIEYRRMEAEGENRKAPWPAVFYDIATAIDFLRQIAQQHNLDLAKVMVIGHSAGGNLATWAGCRGEIPLDSELYRIHYQKIERIVSIAGILNLCQCEDVEQPQQIKRLMGGDFSEHPRRYSACDPNLLHNPNIPINIIHGDSDKAVSITQAYSYRNKASDNVQLTELTDADHFSMLPVDGITPKYWQRLKTIISQEVSLLRDSRSFK